MLYNYFYLNATLISLMPCMVLLNTHNKTIKEDDHISRTPLLITILKMTFSTM